MAVQSVTHAMFDNGQIVLSYTYDDADGHVQSFTVVNGTARTISLTFIGDRTRTGTFGPGTTEQAIPRGQQPIITLVDGTPWGVQVRVEVSA